MINSKKLITYRVGNNVKKGFTMLEVMFAIFIILVGVLGAYTVIQKVISYTYQSSLRLTAAYLAQEGIEIVRNIRDANWVQGEDWDDGLVANPPSFTGCDPGDLGDPNDGYFCEAGYNNLALSSIFESNSPTRLKLFNNFYCYDDSYETPFTRKITITPNGDKLTVSVSVWWNHKGEDKGPVNVQEVLYKWYQ